MIKQNLIIKPTELLTNLPVPDVDPPLKYYTRNAVEDNTQFFLELKHIVQVTEAKVYIDKFNVHLEFRVAWRKLFINFLGTGAKDTLAIELERDIQTLEYNRQRCGYPGLSL